MDILDIDEALKDDSFIFLEDKTHDDVSNILQQWKSNNCMPAPPPPPPAQAQQEQVYKLNTKTFTRPKRKSTQNLETHCINNTTINNGGLQAYPQQPQKCIPVLNLEIGGLVTTMHKSFLQDTSPPSSICSSMEVSLERMNNSLITSADFSNINFLQSTQSLDFANNGDGGGSDYCGYTLSDMIRDRKALESLTMSGDGTLIKDTHIGQIDDISLTLSKTASGSSTMDNSTDSVAADEELDNNNLTIKISDVDRTYDKAIDNVSTLLEQHSVSIANSGDVGVIGNIMQQTMLLSDEMIGDMTFNLVENSICLERPVETNNVTESAPQVMNATMDVVTTTASATSPVNATFKKPFAMNETVCLSPAETNSTFDCQPTTENRCETPENYEKPLKFYESTPQMTSTMRRSNKQQYTPSIATVDDVNVSPIVGTTTRTLNDNLDTPPQSQRKSNINTDTFVGVLPQVETMELLENVENPNATYDHRSAADIEMMQNVMDLAQAEAQLLASNDDEDEFEHMLEEFSRVELNAEQLKMKKSLDSIKKRFNYGHERELAQDARDTREVMHDSGSRLQTPMNATIEITRNMNETSKHLTGERSRDLNSSFLRDSMGSTSAATTASSNEPKSSLLSSKDSSRESQLLDSQTNVLSSWTMSSTSTSGGERLLSRRSRLYDDINLSAISMQHSKGSPNGSAQKNENSTGDCKEETENGGHLLQKTENTNQEESKSQTDNQTESYRLTERRERDRDRFKTIKIIKDRNASNGCASQAAGTELNVPCIDEDESYNQLPVEQIETEVRSQRISRRDQVESGAVFNNNKSETDETATNAARGKGINTNYLTYKKPKGTSSQELKSILPEVTALAPEEIEAAVASKPNAAIKSRLEPRSLSRPRYISGLQKFSVAKATSASDLEQQPTTMPSGNVKFNRMQPNAGMQKTTGAELKSPMGIKSKSFHNLSSNFGYPATTAHGAGAAANKTFGLRKPSSSGSGLADKELKLQFLRNTSAANNATMQEQTPNDNTVFKVPKLVSGLRAPGASALKRAGLVRPSSGYYSLNVAAKGAATAQTAENEHETGRNSPTESMSSASSRGSIQSGSGSSLKPPTAIITNGGGKLALTKITTGSTGIPKPSGLRPPTNVVKRSGLPKPASTARR